MSTESRFILIVTVTAYGEITGEEAARALQDYGETFDAPGGEVEITGVRVAGAGTDGGLPDPLSRRTP